MPQESFKLRCPQCEKLNEITITKRPESQYNAPQPCLCVNCGKKLRDRKASEKPKSIIIDESPARKDDKNPAANADVKAEADGWVYFKHHTKTGYDALFKSRPDGSDLACVAEPSNGSWLNLRNIEIKDGWIYFDVTERYSRFNEAAQEYDRFSDDVTYKIEPDGKERAVVNRINGSLGSSN